MAKTIIKGRFATGADAAAFYEISDARRVYLDDEVRKAIALTLDTLPARGELRKRTAPKRTAPKRATPKRTARARAKRK